MLQARERTGEVDPIRVILVENDAGDAALIKRTLRQGFGHYRVSHCERLGEFFMTTKESDIDIILLDLSLPDSDGLETLRRTRAGAPDVPIVVLTDLVDSKTALAALREGAQDYCVKGEEGLLRIMQYAIERKRFENSKGTIYRADRLAALGQLAAGVAHEINNPATYLIANLLAMKQYTEKLEGVFRALRQPSALLDADAQEVIDTLLADERVDDVLAELGSMLEDDLGGMERIRDITSQLKSFSRIERDDAEWVQVNDVVMVACKMAGVEISHRAELVLDLGDIPPIAAHRGKLAQVILNLLINAAQSIEEGAVELNRVTVRTWHEGDQVFVTIEDTGTGMSGERKRRIFEPFFTTKSRDVGTGLGLTLCAEIVRQHGGNIAVRSEVGEGTCFELILPRDTGLLAVPSGAAPRAGSNGDQEQVRASGFQRARVLVVDDDHLVRSVLVHMLRPDHDVVEASGGNQALELLERDDDFDVILCDLMMPDGDGVMLYEALNRVAPRLRSRTVFLSGGAFTSRARDFIRNRSLKIISKPISKDELVAAVDDVARNAPERGVNAMAVGH